MGIPFVERAHGGDDETLLDPPGPVAVQLLRLDPSKVDLRSALAHDRVMQLETVPDIAGIRRVHDIGTAVDDAGVLAWFSQRRRMATGNDFMFYRRTRGSLAQRIQ